MKQELPQYHFQEGNLWSIRTSGKLQSMQVVKVFYLSVATNGTLITKENAKRLRESGIRYVEVSLDGPEDVHDEFRE